MMTMAQAVQAVIDSQGFEPCDDAFYAVEQEAIEQGYIVRRPGDQYAVTAKGRKLVTA
jgi:hypothetical protein